ncbi:MAG: hypothetical protein AB1665_06245 [Candidatus Thermoplasmatota archaeon]
MEKEMALMRRLLGEISGREDCRRVLLSVKYNQISRINLLLLKLLLEHRGMRGVFVTIDRPHQYMAYLLRLNKVNHDKLIFIDMISRYSGGAEITAGNVRFGSGPFGTTDLLRMMESGGAALGQASVDMGLVDFIMIDNLSAMLVYNDLPEVSTFVQRYLSLIERYGRIFTAIVIDVESNHELYRTLCGLCQKALRISVDGTLEPLEALPEAESDKGSEVSESVLIYTPHKGRPFFPHPITGGG